MTETEELETLKADFCDLETELDYAQQEASDLADENEKLESQVSSLTKERDELQFNAKDHSHKVSSLIKIKNDLQTKLSNREKEVENPNSRFVLNEDLDLVEYDDFVAAEAGEIRKGIFHGGLKVEPNEEVYEALTYGSQKTLFYTFDGYDCHFFWDEQEALASLNKEGEEE